MGSALSSRGTSTRSAHASCTSCTWQLYRRPPQCTGQVRAKESTEGTLGVHTSVRARCCHRLCIKPNDMCQLCVESNNKTTPPWQIATSAASRVQRGSRSRLAGCRSPMAGSKEDSRSPMASSWRNCRSPWLPPWGMGVPRQQQEEGLRGGRATLSSATVMVPCLRAVVPDLAAAEPAPLGAFAFKTATALLAVSMKAWHHRPQI